MIRAARDDGLVRQRVALCRFIFPVDCGKRSRESLRARDPREYASYASRYRGYKSRHAFWHEDAQGFFSEIFKESR
jgi:hypothetical protein